MFRSSRLYDAALGITLVVILLVASAALQDHYKHASGYEPAPDQQYESSKRAAPLGSTPQGGQTDPKTYREEWRAEEDLKAQRQMADWAFLMLVATAFGTCVTAIGVVFVAQTLEATRDAVKEARAANETVLHVGKKQIIAYLTCSNPTLSFQNNSPVLGLSVVNSGNTPAFNVFLELRTGASGEHYLAKPVGDGINGVMAGTIRQSTEPDFVQLRTNRPLNFPSEVDVVYLEFEVDLRFQDVFQDWHLVPFRYSAVVNSWHGKRRFAVHDISMNFADVPLPEQPRRRKN